MIGANVMDIYKNLFKTINQQSLNIADPDNVNNSVMVDVSTTGENYPKSMAQLIKEVQEIPMPNNCSEQEVKRFMSDCWSLNNDYTKSIAKYHTSEDINSAQKFLAALSQVMNDAGNLLALKNSSNVIKSEQKDNSKIVGSLRRNYEKNCSLWGKFKLEWLPRWSNRGREIEFLNAILNSNSDNPLMKNGAIKAAIMVVRDNIKDDNSTLKKSLPIIKDHMNIKEFIKFLYKNKIDIPDSIANYLIKQLKAEYANNKDKLYLISALEKVNNIGSIAGRIFSTDNLHAIINIPEEVTNFNNDHMSQKAYSMAEIFLLLDAELAKMNKTIDKKQVDAIVQATDPEKMAACIMLLDDKKLDNKAILDKLPGEEEQLLDLLYQKGSVPAIKNEILTQFKDSMKDIKTEKDINDKIFEFKSSPQYEILKTNQNSLSKFFDRQTRSIDKFEKICKDVLKTSQEDSKPSQGSGNSKS
jgi:hypothetical protein